MTSIRLNRDFLKDITRQHTDFSETDQSKGIAPPPIQKPYSNEQKLIRLPDRNEWTTIVGTTIEMAIASRKSHRKYKAESISLEELSYLLWATQGIRYMGAPERAYRNVPSAGCRHAFETYLCILNVESLEQGIYRYLPIEHSLILEHSIAKLSEKIISATLKQSFTGKAAVNFIWSVIPYRTEWRYGTASHRVIAIDVGHVCQNLYLACTAINAGTCAIAAFNQRQMDELLGLDGNDEFTIYIAPVGKI